MAPNILFNAKWKAASVNCTLVAAAFLGSSAFAPRAAQANPLGYSFSNGVLSIDGTGKNQTPNPTNYVTDVNGWKAVAVANNNYTANPVNLYLPGAVPRRWYPGQSAPGFDNTTNTAVAGTGTDSGNSYRWISFVNSFDNSCTGSASCAISSYNSSALFGSESYNWIASKTFIAAETAKYTFTSSFTGDNQAKVYLGGTLSSPFNGTYNQLPGIVGGNFLGETSGTNSVGGTTDSLNNLYTISKGGILLTAGTTYTLNYVITDFNNGTLTPYGSTGFLATTTSFTIETPGPLPILGAGAFFVQSRRLRKRIKSVSKSA